MMGFLGMPAAVARLQGCYYFRAGVQQRGGNLRFGAREDSFQFYRAPTEQRDIFRYRHADTLIDA